MQKRHYTFTLQVEAEPVYLNWLEPQIEQIVTDLIDTTADEFTPAPAFNDEEFYQAWSTATIRVYAGQVVQLPLPLVGV